MHSTLLEPDVWYSRVVKPLVIWCGMFLLARFAAPFIGIDLTLLLLSGAFAVAFQLRRIVPRARERSVIRTGT